MRKFLLGLVGIVCALFAVPVFADDGGPISAVTVAGLVEQNGTPTPNAPKNIVSNNGVLKASPNLFNENMETGTLSSASGGPAAMYTRLRSADFTKVEPNTTYTLSADTSGKIKRCLVFLYDTSGSMVGYGRSDNYEALPYTFNTKANTAKIKIVLTAADDSTNLIPSDAQKIQLELGSTATAYRPYGEIYTDGTVETIADSANHTATVATLLGVGDYRDTQNINTGAITRKVGVKVLDGVSTGAKATAVNVNEGKYYAVCGGQTNITGTTTDLLSTHFKAGTFASGYDILYFVATNIVLVSSDQSLTTVDLYNQWLADQYAVGTPVIVVYPLAEPTTESVAGQTMTMAPVSNQTGGVAGMTITTLLTSGATLITNIVDAIKIATTKYAETVFNPLNTALQSAISVVDSVVSNTITQAASIATLQSGKQTRPNDIADDNEKCPAGKQCLLVEDASGVPHWYEIFDPINRWMEAFFKVNPNGQYVDGGADFRRWQGNSAFRETYIDGSRDVYARQWTAASPARTVGGMYQTLPAGDLENAGSWAVEWDGTEGDIDAGAVYGIAKCTSVAGTFANKLTSAQEAAFYELPTPVGQTDRTGYERENFKNCWCKMTAVGVPGEDGTAANGDVYPVNVSSSAWVFGHTSSSAAVCAGNCALHCANYVRSNVSFRSVVFGLSE